MAIKKNQLFALSNAQIDYLMGVYHSVLSGGDGSDKGLLELGSGKSTVATYNLIKSVDKIKFISLDHLRAYVHQTNRDCGKDIVTYAPLHLVGLPYTGGLLCRTYATSALEGLEFNAVLIDGPSGPNVGRVGTLISIWKFLKPGAAIVLDDCDQKDEVFVLRFWKMYFGKKLRFVESRRFGKRPKIMVRMRKL